MRHFWMFASLFLPLCLGGGEPLEVQSESASYNGKAICLSGSVHLEHELGVIDAEEVTLRPAEKGKKVPFSYLTMDRQVTFSMKAGGQFMCGRAELDPQALLGKFYSTDKPAVTYIEMVKGKRDTLTPLVVKARAMEMNVAAATGRHYIDRILALEDVVIDYNGNFSLTSDRALYRRVPVLEGESAFLKSLPGTITLEPKEGTFCHAKNTQGDLIEAVKIVIDANRREINFEDVKGSICTVMEKKPVIFSSAHLSWNLARKFLKLADRVILEQAPMGTCTSDKEMHLYYTEAKGKKQLSLIESFGKTTLYYHGSEKAKDYRLTCQGKVLVDHQKMETTMQALADADGKTIPSTIVHFRTSGFELKAEKCTIKYLQQEGKLVVSKIIAEGDVSLLGVKSSNPKQKSNETPKAQASKAPPKRYYALADRVDFTPATEEIYCSAHTPKARRVLFYDQSNQLQISAPALKIKRESKKELIQGVGDVRLTFLDSELVEIKKYFKLE